MNPHGKRTQAALDWIDAAPLGETRTQLQAASRFGIAQATIAGAVARRRSKCPTCGQKVKPVAGMAQDAGMVRAVAPQDARLVELAQAVKSYAWHLSDCPAYGGGGECTCGFSAAEIAARSVC